MSDLFMMMFFLSMAAIVIGMLNPDIVLKFLSKEKRTKKMVLIVFVTTMIGSLVLAALV